VGRRRRSRVGRRQCERHASDSPMPGECEGGYIFDEIQDLIEPIERPHKDVRAGLTSHGWCGVARTKPAGIDPWCAVADVALRRKRGGIGATYNKLLIILIVIAIISKLH
jgi:hypothetical protein